MIVGVDEVGRGPWAGPLVIGAVVLDTEIEGLTDSKKLSKKRRDELNTIILRDASAVGIGWVHAEELDEMGMSAALTECCLRALRKIEVPFHEIIIDGTVNLLKNTPLESYVTTMKKADLLVPSVSAASIVAKVARDRFMEEQDDVFPGYGFAKHVGYGTATHRTALDRLGPCSLHRKSFAPIEVYYQDRNIKDTTKRRNAQTTRAVGDKSETAACKYLMKRGYDIVEQNWKTKYCEIDIVASKDNVFYFIEVKHRKKSSSGNGLSAITPKKQRQMAFAAEFYVHSHKLAVERMLIAMSTTGDEPVVETMLELR